MFPVKVTTFSGTRMNCLAPDPRFWRSDQRAVGRGPDAPSRSPADASLLPLGLS